MELPNVGRVCLEDPETGRQVIVNTSLPHVRRTYERRMEQMESELLGALNRNNLERVVVRTDADYLPALRSYFRSRKRR